MLVEAAEDAAAAAVTEANQKADAAVAAAEEERARSAAAQLELKQVCEALQRSSSSKGIPKRTHQHPYHLQR